MLPDDICRCRRGSHALPPLSRAGPSAIPDDYGAPNSMLGNARNSFRLSSGTVSSALLSCSYQLSSDDHSGKFQPVTPRFLFGHACRRGPRDPLGNRAMHLSVLCLLRICPMPTLGQAEP